MPEAREAARSQALGAALVPRWILLGSVLGLSVLLPPAPVPPSAPAAEFSSGRALAHLQWIARAPHAPGWAEHERVRAELVRQLEALGLEVQEREATAVQRVSSPRRTVSMGRVRNVVARLPGREPTAKALMLVAHYDSTPHTPGTSDDGFGVATLLETARALTVEPPRHDIFFLFTDGEEHGLLGARSFMESDPLRERVGLVLNFEARGNRGPVLAFQTSPGNRWLIEHLARAPYPVASSMSQAVYALLPNDTDLTEFMAGGLPGMNFANIQGFGHYHSMTDTVEAASEGTLQHHGSYALALARRFSALPLHEVPASTDAVYFNAGPLFFHSSQAWVLPLSVLVACVLVAVVLRFRRSWRGWQIVLGGLLQLGLVLAAAASAFVLNWLLRGLSGPLIDTHTPLPSALSSTGTLLLALTPLTLLASWVLRRRPATSLTLGALLIWLALTLTVSLLLPGASYLFQFPLLCATASLAVSAHAEERMATVWTAWAGTALLLPPVVLVASVGGLLDDAGNLPIPSAVLSALLAGAFLPQLGVLLGAWQRRLPLALSTLGAMALVAAGVIGRSDGDQSRPGQLFYALDGESAKARWLRNDPHLDHGSRGLLQKLPPQEARPFFPRRGASPLLGMDAPPVAVPLPEARLLNEQREAGVRRLELQLHGVGAPLLEVFIGPEVGAAEAQVDGRPVPLANDGALSLRYWALPEQGVRLTLQVVEKGPLPLRLVSWRPGVPQSPEVSARWKDFRGSTHTLASRAFSF